MKVSARQCRFLLWRSAAIQCLQPCLINLMLRRKTRCAQHCVVGHPPHSNTTSSHQRCQHTLSMQHTCNEQRTHAHDGTMHAAQCNATPSVPQCTNAHTRGYTHPCHTQVHTCGPDIYWKKKLALPCPQAEGQIFAIGRIYFCWAGRCRPASSSPAVRASIVGTLRPSRGLPFFNFWRCISDRAFRCGR